MTAGGRLRLELSSLEGEGARDTAVARALLQRVDEGALPATLRLARPQRVVAFSGRDAASSGFPDAVAAAERHGFASVLRLAGGRAAVFTPATISFSLAEPDEVPREGIGRRFAAMSAHLRDALRAVGVDAHIGEVPGEYCPGEWSVHARGAVKIAGVGQRLLRRAAHTGGVLVVGDAAPIRDVLVDVQAAMDLDWDPATVGAVVDEIDGATWEAVRDALVDAFAADHDLEPWTLDVATLALADELTPQHRPGGRLRGRDGPTKAVVEHPGQPVRPAGPTVTPRTTPPAADASAARG